MRSLWNYLFGSSPVAPTNGTNYSSLNGEASSETIDGLDKAEPVHNEAVPEILLDGIGEPLETVHLTDNDFTNIKKLEFYKGLKIGIVSTGIVFGIIIIIIVMSVVFACK
jgi:hypothetical protein